MSAGSSTGPPPGGFLVASTGHGSVRSTNSRQGDPPREAKEGYEWVWYPDGYWAERQLERRNSNREANGSQSSSQGSQMQSAVNKVFRWGPSRGSRSPREPQPADPTERVESVSPMTITTPSLGQKSLSPFGHPKTLPSSPYMSEEEQTLSLQHPGKKDTWTRFNSRAAPIAELISHGRRLSSQPIGPKPAWGALRKTKEASTRFHSLFGSIAKLTVSTGRGGTGGKRATAHGDGARFSAELFHAEADPASPGTGAVRQG